MLLQQLDRSALLFRQYVKYSLYDRMSTRPFLNSIEKRWIAFQLLCALNQCHKLKVCCALCNWCNVIFCACASILCVCVCIYTCIPYTDSLSLSLSLSLFMCVYVRYASVSVCVCVCVCVCVHINLCVCVCVCVLLACFLSMWLKTTTL